MRGITKLFPGVHALDKFSFDVRAGEVHALVGENGAGKSTLMKILYGVYSPDEGEILINGKKVKIKNAAEALKLGIGEVFQELNTCTQLDVANNIFIGNLKTKFGIVDDRYIRNETRNILKNTVGLKIEPTRLVRDLSVAERQMLEIGKVLSRGGRMIVFDEPTTSLTDNEIQHLFDIILKLKAEGMGIVYISHRLEELSAIADRVTVMRDGKHVRTMDYKDMTNEELVNLMIGREMTEQFPAYRRKIGDVVFRAQGIRGRQNVNIADISVRKGEIVGLAGLVGSGRTESMRAIFGADKAKVDEVSICGEKVRPFRNVYEAIDKGFLYMTEDRKVDGLALSLNIEKNINIASLALLSKGGVVNGKKAEGNAQKYTSSLQIKTPGIHQVAQFLSGGNQQKVILAKWMSCDPKVLVFDEPTKGIDVGAKYEIYKLMNALSDKGVGIILISSDLTEIIGMSDRVLVYRQGSVVAELESSEIEAANIMQYATGVRNRR